MSPERRQTQLTEERAIKAIKPVEYPYAMPDKIALPLSDEGHVIEGSFDDILQHPNAIDGLVYANKAFWEAQGFDEISIEKNVNNHTETARTMIERLNSESDLATLKRNEREEAVKQIERARMVLRTMVESTHRNYMSVVETMRPQPTPEPSPVTVFSAQEQRRRGE